MCIRDRCHFHVLPVAQPYGFVHGRYAPFLHIVNQQIVDNANSGQQQDEIGHAVHGLQKGSHCRKGVGIKLLYGPAPVGGIAEEIPDLRCV